jgi:hypothetical protein
MLFFLAFHFSLSLTPNCRNWSPNYSVLVFIAFIHRNNSGLTNLQRLSHAVFHVLYICRPRLQDGGTPLLLSVLTLESDSRPGKGLHRQSNLPQSLHRPWLLQIFISNYTVQLQCLQCAPGSRVTEKAIFSALIVGLAGL